MKICRQGPIVALQFEKWGSRGVEVLHSGLSESSAQAHLRPAAAWAELDDLVKASVGALPVLSSGL